MTLFVGGFFTLLLLGTSYFLVYAALEICLDRTITSLPFDCNVYIYFISLRGRKKKVILRFFNY